MIIWIRLSVRPNDGAPVLSPDRREIGKILDSREHPDGMWEVRVEIEDLGIACQFEERFPKYMVREIK
jgi:hypothetical protein